MVDQAAADRPRRRPDLVILERHLDDEVFFVISNPHTNEYLRLGDFERAIFDLLDGSRTLPEIAAAFEAGTGTAIEIDDLDAFVDGLRSSGFVETAVFDPAQILEEFRQRERAGLARRQLISGTVTLLRFLPFNPDRILGRMAAAVPWIWSRTVFVLSWVLIGAATVAAVSLWDRLGPAYLNFFKEALTGGAALVGSLFLIYMLEAITVVYHELAHGLTLKHYGGPVPEMGFALAYLQFPGAYTDTSAAYILPSRFQRVMVSMAGGYVELLGAAAAVFLWWATPTGSVVNDMALILIATGGPLTLLFNWNPLMPFDGYYMAVDLLEAPNLLPRSFGYLGDLARERIFRVPPVHPRPPVRLRRIYAIFGSLAWVYQGLWLIIVPWAALYLFSAMLGKVLGAILATAVTLHFARHPVRTIVRFVQYVAHERRSTGERLGAPGRAGLYAAGLIALAAFLVPACPATVSGKAILEPETRFEVRAHAAGFVGGIHVLEGSRVEAGQSLVDLENPDLEALVAGLDVEIEMTRASMLRREARGDLPGAAQWRTILGKLAEERGILAARRESLRLTAPGPGILMGPRLEDRAGTRLEEGDHWCVVAGTERLHAVISVSETDLRDVPEGAPVVARADGFPGVRFRGKVLRLPHLGWVPEPEEKLDDTEPAPRKPARYDVEVLLENHEDRLRPGQEVHVRIYGAHRSVAARLGRLLWDLFRGRVWW